jgi:hypothetical protein
MTQRFTTFFTAITLMAIAYSCKNTNTATIKTDSLVAKSSTDTTNTIDVDTTYKMAITNNTDSVVLNNANYIVTTKPNEGEPGELIVVYNKVTKQSFAVPGDNSFVAISNHYLLTEGGTTANYRLLEVYDIANLKMVFSSQYETDLNIENNIVSFKTAVTLTDPALTPKCNAQQNIPASNLGYIEQQYFNLNTLTLQKTGKYACWYFE